MAATVNNPSGGAPAFLRMNKQNLHPCLRHRPCFPFLCFLLESADGFMPPVFSGATLSFTSVATAYPPECAGTLPLLLPLEDDLRCLGLRLLTPLRPINAPYSSVSRVAGSNGPG